MLDRFRINADKDYSLLIISGLCSIHFPEQAIEHTKMLRKDVPNRDGFRIIMHAYLCLPSPQL